MKKVIITLTFNIEPVAGKAHQFGRAPRNEGKSSVNRRSKTFDFTQDLRIMKAFFEWNGWDRQGYHIRGFRGVA